MHHLPERNAFLDNYVPILRDKLNGTINVEIGTKYIIMTAGNLDKLQHWGARLDKLITQYIEQRIQL